MTRLPWEDEDDEDAAPEGYQMRAANAFDAERARRIYCERQERQREARLVYAYRVAAA